MKFPKITRKTFLLFSIISLLVVLSATFWWNSRVSNFTNTFIFDSSEALPKTKTGLLLGTSKLLKSGNVNEYFANRIIAAVELYNSGKIEKIIISGDNSRTGYDEPTDMKLELIKNGVDSTDIFLDYAGFRTYDSVIRLREIFDQQSAIVISQQFHNERAVYIGRANGIELFGYNAKDVNVYYGFKTRLRELFARDKMAIDILFGINPKFLGEKVAVH